MNDGVVYDRSFKFAIRIVNAYKFLTYDQREFVISKQLLRSGTAIGALCAEAKYAQSRADFINKMHIALKEASETEYWLNVLKSTDYIEEKIYMSIIEDCKQLIKLLVSIVKTSKETVEKV
ncbi:MAG: four helix bundle protein [Paludibacteraceae bacterium]|nr:four helix bundle protein [Paludibacteraceae bacterium]